MTNRPSVPPGRESLHNAVLEASELRRHVAELRENDQQLKEWRERMQKLLGKPK